MSPDEITGSLNASLGVTAFVHSCYLLKYYLGHLVEQTHKKIVLLFQVYYLQFTTQLQIHT